MAAQRRNSSFINRRRMSAEDPRDRNPMSSQERALEYLKGLAKAPLGWPAMPRVDPIDPAELQEMLERVHERRSREGPPRPWYKRRATYVAAALFAALIAAMVWLITNAPPH